MLSGEIGSGKVKCTRTMKIGVLSVFALGLSVFTIVMLTGIRTLDEDEQILLIDSGGRSVEDGPAITWVRPGRQYEIRKNFFLLETQYMIITDLQTGIRRVQRGPGRFFLGPYESASGDEESAVSLTPRDYIHVTDKLTGEVRTVRGPQLYFPKHANENFGFKRQAIQLASYETIVVKEANGAFTYNHGSLENTEAVLQPGSELVQFRWSQGPDMETNLSHVTVDKIDTRIRQLHFWFDDIRSRDNMEFELEGVIFWQILDVPKMVTSTGDPTSDIWHHLRARLAEASTKESFLGFLANASRVKDAVLAEELSNRTEFYSHRGLKLHSMDLIEVELHSDDLATRITDQIAAEATVRLNTIEQAITQNQVESTRITGEHAHAMQSATNEAALQASRQNATHNLRMTQIESQKLYEAQRLELLELMEANALKEASSSGAASGLQLAKTVDEYLSNLNTTLPGLGDRLSLYRLHQELQSRNTTTANLASGKAQLIVTPDHVHLSLYNRTDL